MKYIASVCPRCGKASAARASAKTHQCPYCGAAYSVDSSTILLVGTAREVREAVVRHNSEK
ncbi:hypothetical protein [Pyrobaculum calidifontis]|uniref:DUF1922 domain-containing protein n=1 Tax=Pyrobaculum calidifontis (strain DSM 21063 / JCM 11548 / VA1) TaxID=410359 RepID=A3MUB4_PYRCJ|nr:hypothetical protein [Pyrobaculum calidifontis]ABO08231.1 conserved hypothetical protein [Pyrobaculum calidifontis JCM 11548]